LEYAGILKREKGNYVINKVLLENCIRISRFLIPRYLFYSILAVVVFLVELTILRPMVFNREYLFSVVATALFAVIFSYETGKAWIKGSL
jgi:hypothetical protein